MEIPSIYGDKRERLETVMNHLISEIDHIRKNIEQAQGMDPVEHCLGRIKSEESMREKCRRKNLPETTKSALKDIYDAIGIRVVCAFVSDVYAIRDCIVELPDVEIINEKDYILHAKPNGYRSYHLILLYEHEVYAELQLRTISMDTWAALDHHLKYKKEIVENHALIEEELKRCADELASTDLSMQTIRDMIFSS